MGQACTDSRTSIEKQIDEFRITMSKFPSMKRYAYNKTHIATFTKAWANGQFGGNVFKPLGTYTKNKKGVLVASKRSRTNVLEDDVKKSQLNSLYGGGYYQIMKVQQFKDNKLQFYDIFLLTESVENKEHLEKFKKATEDYKNWLKPPKKGIAKLTGSTKDKDFIQFEDIKESINGYARIISYKAINGNPESENNELESVFEGKFKNGLKDGYCRGISAINGSASAGFHKEGIPHGKWTAYKYNGEFSHPEGFYEGTTCTKNIGIMSFNEGIAKTN